MKVTVEKSKIPILWLDTFVLIDLVRRMHGKDVEKKEYAEKVVRRCFKFF